MFVHTSPEVACMATCSSWAWSWSGRGGDARTLAPRTSWIEMNGYLRHGAPTYTQEMFGEPFEGMLMLD